jgi:hypothetical protein
MVDAPAIEVGTVIASASVRIDEIIIKGDLSLRYARSVESSGMEFGCLFYPASPDDMTNWMLFCKQRLSDGPSPTPQFALRCSNCHSLVDIYLTNQTSYPCPECGQEYQFGKPISAGSLENMHRKARGMAVELGIDLPSALSLLLGLVKLSEVRDILDDSPPAEQETEETGGARKQRFDKAFMPAIEAGTLTEAAAIQRGNREEFARKLVARHRISMDDAEAVADNRKSLLGVVRARAAGEPIVAQYGRPAAPVRLAVAVGLAVIVLLLGAGGIRKFDSAFNEPAAGTDLQRAPATTSSGQPDVSSVTASAVATHLEQQPVESYARVRADEHGRLVSVEAMNPENALLAFCKSHGAERRLQPLDILPTDPPSDSARIGILRDLEEAASYKVVVIRRDHSTRRWYLGNKDDSEATVSMFPAPDQLIAAVNNPD